ncbi:response regulator [Photobacterium alginatilyticum]|uniref:response regulator n=1 Tax=Photobacterium alginatilyticum TaxID=1775171 RepID=UPI004068EF8D
MAQILSSNSQSIDIDFSKLRVLIIDDQRTAAAMLKSLLNSLGLRNIDVSLTHQQAIESCKKHHYDLLLTDYHLDATLNGFELLCLLRKRKYISADCGIIMISGDASTEVILTSMAVEPDSFMTKPVTLSGLKKKLAEVRTACIERKPIYEALEVQGLNTAIELCKKQLREQGHNHRIEALLLDLLIESGQWEQAEQITTILKRKNPTHQISLIEARLLHHKGMLADAIAVLEQLIKRSPLIMDAYDCLSQYQEESQHYYEALATAETALSFTPSISHRALRVAQLAADLNNTENLVTAGKTLASRLPIIDIGWIIRFAEFTAIFEQLYFAQSSSKSRRLLRQELKAIHHRAHSRLLPIQQPFLDCFGHITLARLYLAQEQPLKAKRRLLLGLSTYFDSITKLPSVILADVLPALVHLGETKLIGEINRALKLRDQFDGHSQNRLDALRSNEALIQSVRNLESTLAHCYQLFDIHQADQALILYEHILIDYPYCSEAHIGRLQCLYLLKQFDEDKVRQSLQAVSAMPLPDDLAQWRDNVLSLMSEPQQPPRQMRLALTYRKRVSHYLPASSQTPLAS